jgi:hypothetical protein
VRDKKPDLVILMETKMKQIKNFFLKSKLGFDNIFFVDCMGKSCGLALLWKGETGVEI